jgi:hypothetical protein
VELEPTIELAEGASTAMGGLDFTDDVDRQEIAAIMETAMKTAKAKVAKMGDLPALVQSLVDQDVINKEECDFVHYWLGFPTPD